MLLLAVSNKFNTGMNSLLNSFKAFQISIERVQNLLSFEYNSRSMRDNFEKRQLSKQISLHNALILDLEEPNLTRMIVNFQFFFIIGSENLKKNY